MSQLTALCERKRVRIDSRYGEAPPNDSFKESTGWMVTLRYRGRRLTVPFYMGSALDREPTAADVLSCLCSDTMSIENSGGFEDWASDLGYDTDSRKAEETYRQCEKIATRLRTFLGDDFEAFCRAEH